MTDETRILISSGIAALVRAATTAPAPFGYGRDPVCTDDLTPTLKETDPNTIESLAQDLFHRITTERGSIPDDPDFGEDARNFLSAGTTSAGLIAAAGRLQLECGKDDRVAHVDVTAVFTAPGELTINLAVTPELAGLQPFNLIVALTATTAPTLTIQ